MVPNPCCMSLESGVKAVAIGHMVLDVIGFILYLLVTIKFGEYASENSGVVFIMVIAVFVMLCCILHFALSIVLYQGAEQHNHSKCRIWFIVTIVFTIFSLLGSFGSGRDDILVGIVLTLIKIYLLWVVFAFMDEIKRGQGTTELRNDPEVNPAQTDK